MRTDDDSLDMDDTIITDNSLDYDDYDSARQATAALDMAYKNLCHINNGITDSGRSWTVNAAVEYTKTVALIGIGHALTAIARNLADDNDTEDDVSFVADLLTHNIITDQFNN